MTTVQPPLEIDHQAEEEFSNYGSDVESETQSVCSSLNEYIYQNGRRYHSYYGPDKNPMPTDDEEQERLDIVHEVALLSTGNHLYQAPLKPERLHRVLDLGTGTGIWAIDFARQNSQSEVYGMDLSPIQPGWVPPNCRFETDDFGLDWTYKRPFDFIHARMIVQSVDSWERLLEQAKNHLNPGGWIELVEVDFITNSDDDSMPEDWPPRLVMRKVIEALEKIGRVTLTPTDLKAKLEAAGFTETHIVTNKLPVGLWPKDPDQKQAGGLMLLGVEQGAYEAYAMQLCTTVLGMSTEEVTMMCERAKEAHRTGKYKVHAYQGYTSVYARKPE